MSKRPKPSVNVLQDQPTGNLDPNSPRLLDRTPAYAQGWYLLLDLRAQDQAKHRNAELEFGKAQRRWAVREQALLEENAKLSALQAQRTGDLVLFAKQLSEANTRIEEAEESETEDEKDAKSKEETACLHIVQEGFNRQDGERTQSHPENQNAAESNRSGYHATTRMKGDRNDYKLALKRLEGFFANQEKRIHVLESEIERRQSDYECQLEWLERQDTAIQECKDEMKSRLEWSVIIDANIQDRDNQIQILERAKDSDKEELEQLRRLKEEKEKEIIGLRTDVQWLEASLRNTEDERERLLHRATQLQDQLEDHERLITVLSYQNTSDGSVTSEESRVAG